MVERSSRPATGSAGRAAGRYRSWRAVEPARGRSTPSLVELGSHGSSPRRRRDRRRRRRGRVDRAPSPVVRPTDAGRVRAAGAARPQRLRPTGGAVAGRRVHVGDVRLVRRCRQQGGGAGGRRRRRRRGRVPGPSATSTPATRSTRCRRWCSPMPTAWCAPGSSDRSPPPTCGPPSPSRARRSTDSGGCDRTIGDRT